jgi:hypothetical protein
MKLHKLLAALQAICGVLIAFTPTVLPACAELLKTTMGTSVPMKCHWTAQAEIAMGILIAIVGALIFAFATQVETRGALNAVVLALGVVVLLIPTVMIGTCGDQTHTCNIGMKPALLLLGSATLLLGAVGLWDAWRSSRPTPLATA